MLRFPISGAVRMSSNGNVSTPAMVQTSPTDSTNASTLEKSAPEQNATQTTAPPALKPETGSEVPLPKNTPARAASKKRTATVQTDPAGLYARAFSGYEAGRYAAAREQFQVFRSTFPSHGLAPNAQYWIGETLYAERRLEEAARAFELVVRLYPRHAKCPDALLKLAYVAKRQGKDVVATKYLDQLENSFPDSSAAKLGRQARSALPGHKERAGAAGSHG